jgi:hypothetical protein
MAITKTEYQELLNKIETLKRSGGVDLSTEEDLAIAVMNLISLEEHFFFTSAKTGKSGYLDLLSEIREARKNLMARLVPKHEGETWCISKHLLAATMRLIEVGTKLRAEGKKKEAEEAFDYSHKLWTFFWALRLRLIDVGNLKKAAESEKAWTLQDILDKLVDCCDE